MLVYPPKMSKSLDCSPRISYSPHVSKSARLESLDLQPPGFSFFGFFFLRIFTQQYVLSGSVSRNSLFKIFRKEKRIK